jgi:hypothetical protein
MCACECVCVRVCLRACRERTGAGERMPPRLPSELARVPLRAPWRTSQFKKWRPMRRKSGLGEGLPGLAVPRRGDRTSPWRGKYMYVRICMSVCIYVCMYILSWRWATWSWRGDVPAAAASSCPLSFVGMMASVACAGSEPGPRSEVMGKLGAEGRCAGDRLAPTEKELLRGRGSRKLPLWKFVGESV